MNIRTRLRVLILVSLVPVGLFGVTAAYLAVQKERQTMETGMRDRAAAIMSAVENELQTSINALEILATSAALNNGDLDAFRIEAQRMLAARHGNWGNIIVYDVGAEQKMNILVPSPGVLPRGTDRQGVIAVAEHRRPAVGHLRMARILQRPVFSLRVPVFQGDHVIYVLTAVVNAEAIARIVEKQNIPESWAIAVLDQDYRFVYRRPMLDQGNEYASESLRNVLSRASHGWDRGHLVDGKPIYRAYQRSTLGNWAASVAVPKEIVDQSLNQLWLFMTAFATTTIVALWIALRLASRISEPIAALAAAGPALSRGDASAIPLPGPVKEVRQLSEALGQAAVAVRERQEQQWQTEQALRDADRAKDQFLATVCQELRNPLSSISNAAQLLKLTQDQAAIQKISAILGRQVEHMTGLVDTLAEVGRAMNGKVRLDLEPLDLADVVSDFVDTWHSGNRFAQYTVSNRSESVWVLADRGRIEQILSSLLENALKYTPANGHIDVMVYRGGEHAVLQVSDTGTGMTPESIERIYNLFVQGENGVDHESRLGVGLTMAKRLTELHGGAINLSSEGTGKGARFTVILPAIRPPREDAPPLLSHTAASGQQRILIIDHDADGRESLAALLRFDMHEVQLCATGGEGLDLAITQSFDIALIDLDLPDIDGYELAQRLRDQADTKTMRLIALTGYVRQDERRRALAAGFDAHMVKPVQMETLRGILTGI